MVKGNLDPSLGETYKTAIVSLGHIAFHLPDKFPIHIKNLVSRKIVRELLMQDRSEVREEPCESKMMSWSGAEHCAVNREEALGTAWKGLEVGLEEQLQENIVTPRNFSFAV